MSATMARQGGQVLLEQSDMCRALTIAIMAKGGCPRAAVQEMQYVIKNPHAKVREEKKWAVWFPLDKQNGGCNGKARSDASSK